VHHYSKTFYQRILKFGAWLCQLLLFLYQALPDFRQMLKIEKKKSSSTARKLLFLFSIFFIS